MSLKRVEEFEESPEAMKLGLMSLVPLGYGNTYGRSWKYDCKYFLALIVTLRMMRL